MKSLFSMGFTTQGFFWQPGFARLGQAAAGSLSPDDRDALFKEVDKLIQMRTQIEAFGDRSDYVQQLGALAGDFNGYRSIIGIQEGDMEDLWKRLTSDSAEDWYWTDDDRANFIAYRDAVQKAYQMILDAQKRSTAPAPAASTPGTVRTPITLIPIKPSPAPKPGLTLPAPVQPTILGIKQNDLLIGGGIAVGLGLLFYALT